MGIDSICILRDRDGFRWNESAKKYHERKARPTATILDVIGLLSVCFAAAKKLMEECVCAIRKLNLMNVVELQNGREILRHAVDSSMYKPVYGIRWYAVMYAVSCYLPPTGR